MMDTEVQGYSDSALETVAARSADHASVTAQNGEAPHSDASSMTRTAAAVRLDMEAAATAFPDGLSSARSLQDVPFDVVSQL